MNDEFRMNEEWERIKNEGLWFQAVEGFWLQTDRWMDRIMDMCECRVTFATENILFLEHLVL